MRPSTFSIVARDPDSGDLGVAVQSKFLAVGAVVPWAKAGVGAVATQAHVNTTFGPDGLALLEQGQGVIAVLEQLIEEDEGRAIRQAGMVDAGGDAAAYTGEDCMAWAGHLTGPGYACQGNILAGERVVQAMAEAFEAVEDDLAERLIAALVAGQAAGGDRRGQQSAALLVVREGGGYGGFSDRLVDLRVDDHPAPIDELQRLYALHRLYFGVTNPADLLKIEGSLAAEIQGMLHCLGYYDGPRSGVYDEVTRSALERWHGVENFEERFWEEAFIDPEVLAFMRKKAEEERPES